MHTPGTTVAVECFKEAIKLMERDPATASLVDYNLYNGLANLAYAVGQMQQEIESLRSEVRTLTQK